MKWLGRGPDGFETSRVGAAVAIHADGYFLTAAHCVDSGPVLLLCARKGRPPIEVRGTVVWRGQERLTHCDLAIVHASVPPGELAKVMRWSADHRPPVGARVLVAGSGATGIRVAGGKVLRVESVEFDNDSGKLASNNRQADFPRYAPLQDVQVIYNDIPVLPGDSGGPVMLEDGTLLGIAVGGLLGEQERAIVLRPDTKWLEQAVATHRNWVARHGATEPRVESSTVGWLRLQQLQG